MGGNWGSDCAGRARDRVRLSWFRVDRPHGCVTSPASREPDPAFARQTVAYATHEPPGTIVIDPASHFLYLVQGGGKAIRYGVGVGAEGFVWSGRATVHTKQEWPDWYPPAEMLQRKPELRAHMVQLQSGIGMKGGPKTQLAPAVFISGTATRIRFIASMAPMSHGRLYERVLRLYRLTNEDVIDLYDRTPKGTKVIVLAMTAPADVLVSNPNIATPLAGQ